MPCLALLLVLLPMFAWAADDTPVDAQPEATIDQQQVDYLIEQGRYDDAEVLLNSILAFETEHLEAKRGLARVRIARREAEIRGLVAEQAELYDEVLGHPDYEREKALTSGIERARLDMVEYLVADQRYEDALRLVNDLLVDYPGQPAAMQIKVRLLDKVYKREVKRLEQERQMRRQELMAEAFGAGFAPREAAAKPRTVLVFDEELEQVERDRLQAKLRATTDIFQFNESPLREVLDTLFRVAGMNFIFDDAAMGEETLTINIVDSTVEEVLGVIQRMLPVRFNYHAGAVYVTSTENPVLITEMYRLKSGLTDVLTVPTVSSTSSSGSGEGGAGGAGGAGGILPSGGGGGGGGGGGNSDMERFLERIPELIDWPEGSSLYLEPKSSTLYIRSSPSAVAEVKRLLKAIDYTSTQVLIEAKFLEMTDEASKTLGIKWGMFAQEGTPNQDLVVGGIASGGPPQGGDGVLSGLTGNGFNAGIGGFGDDLFPNFSAALQALEEKKQLNTLSEPKILALSNATGVIDIRREIPYIADYENRSLSQTIIVNDSDSPSNSGLTTLVPVFQSVYEGINLQVTPSVARNSDIITLKLVPTIRDVNLVNQEFTTTAGSGSISNTIQNPRVNQRQLQTTLHIRNGQTIVLGGLIAEDSNKGREGVPGLQDAPAIGGLFRTDTRNSNRSKLLIFVTAHIIDPSGSKHSEDIRVLRDTAEVVLPAEVRAERERLIRAERKAAAKRRAELAEETDERNAARDDGGPLQRPSKGPRR